MVVVALLLGTKAGDAINKLIVRESLTSGMILTLPGMCTVRLGIIKNIFEFSIKLVINTLCLKLHVLSQMVFLL